MVAMAAALVGGCVAGPGSKPSSLRWKEYKDVKLLAFPPASWNSGELRFDLASVELVRYYTVLGTKSHRLNFHVKVRNQGAETDDVFNRMAKGSLVLQDGSAIERLVWVADTVKLEAGKETKGMYFSDYSLKEGASPKELSMNGNVVARW